MKRTRELPQERNRRRTQRADALVKRATLWIPVAPHERDPLRERVWYSGAAPDYIATSMAALPLAVREVCDLRGVKRVTVVSRADGSFELRTRKKRA